MRTLFAGLALPLAALAGPFRRAGQAQASYAGTGPGSYISLGVTASGFYSGEYGKIHIAGGAVFLNANLYRKIGVEAEARELNLHSNEGLHETNYLIGPKLSAKGRSFRPYAKFLAGRGDFRFPFGYGYGRYFMIAPGAGIDYRFHQGKIILRAVDFEYQIYPDFTPFGTLHPYGLSSGVSFRIF